MTPGTMSCLARPRRFPALAALAAAAAVAAPARADDPAPDVRSFDVALAPVMLDGTFEVTIATTGGDVTGTLTVDTDVRGKLSGTFRTGVLTLAVSGSVSHGKKGTRASFTASAGKERLTFSGAVTGTSLAGKVTGKGTIAPGKNTFAADVAASGPLVARIDLGILEDAKGKLSGTGRVTACGDSLDLKVSGVRGRKTLSVTLKGGKSFTFTGTGAPDAADPLLDWTAAGFGVKASGTAAEVLPLAMPESPAYAEAFYEVETESAIAPLVPVAGSAPRGAFSVSPALPAGLRLDPSDGTISGTPAVARDTTTYTVSASNFAGTRTGTVSIRTRSPRWKSFAVETRALTDDDYRHFLDRAQFGVTQAALDSVRSQGLDSYVDSMLNFATNGPAEAIAAPELRTANEPAGYEGKFPSSTQLGRWWSSLMMNTDNPFQERLAFFWHDHFAAASDVLEGSEMHFMTDYVNLFRYEGNGNLRTLLVKMARDPCMLKFLDGYRNSAARPNENFAREFWELFTLGVDNGYSQADIVQAARAFTGYRRTTATLTLPDGVSTTTYTTMTFDRALFDTGSKTIFGQYVIPAQNPATATDDFQAIADITVDHRPVAEFITKKLFEHFGYASPPQSLVDEMAVVLRQGNYELRPFLKRMFQSEAFFSAPARRALVKSPVDLNVGFIRSTGLKITVSNLGNGLSTLGQFPTLPPSVSGWPQGELWLSSQNMVDRINLVYTCIEDTTRQRTNGIEVANILPPAGQRTAANVVDHLAALLRVELTPAQRQSCIDYVQTTVTGSSSAPVGALNPSFTLDSATQAQLDERVRGLLYVLAQHPTYQIR